MEKSYEKLIETLELHIKEQKRGIKVRDDLIKTLEKTIEEFRAQTFFSRLLYLFKIIEY